MSDVIFGEAGSKARTYIPVRHPAHVALLYSALDLVEEVLAKLAQQSHDKRGVLAAAFFVRMREFSMAASTLLLFGQQKQPRYSFVQCSRCLYTLRTAASGPSLKPNSQGPRGEI